MTRYYASGARSRFFPHLFHTISTIRIYKDFKKERSVSALRAPQGQSRLQNTHTSAMNANL